MPSGPNPILSSTNTFISVTNYDAYEGTFGGTTRSISTLGCIPLTTSDRSATGQISVAVAITGGSPGPATGGEFTTTTTIATGAGTISAGALGFSVTAISGTPTFNGATLPAGATVSGGGYPGYVTEEAISYNASGAQLLVSFDLPSP